MGDISEFLSNKLLGYSNNIQGGMELDKNTGQWRLLLQVDSNEDTTGGTAIFAL